jgi:hypothetical protein
MVAVAKRPAITTIKIRNLFIEHLLVILRFGSQFSPPATQPSPTQGRNISIEVLSSIPKWVFFIPP